MHSAGESPETIKDFIAQMGESLGSLDVLSVSSNSRMEHNITDIEDQD
jgi:hypothetical protein